MAEILKEAVLHIKDVKVEGIIVTIQPIGVLYFAVVCAGQTELLLENNRQKSQPPPTAFITSQMPARQSVNYSRETGVLL